MSTEEEQVMCANLKNDILNIKDEIDEAFILCTDLMFNLEDFLKVDNKIMYSDEFDSSIDILKDVSSDITRILLPTISERM